MHGTAAGDWGPQRHQRHFHHFLQPLRWWRASDYALSGTACSLTSAVPHSSKILLAIGLRMAATLIHSMQANIPFTMVLAFICVGTRFSRMEYVGALVIFAGLAV